MLWPSFIEAVDDHGAATVIEPTLNTVAHVGRSVDPGILIMRNTDVLLLCVSDQVRGTFQGLHLADHSQRGRLPGKKTKGSDLVSCMTGELDSLAWLDHFA